MHATTPLISTIAGGLVLAFLLGILANRLRISPLVGLFACRGSGGAVYPRFCRGYRVSA